MFRFIANFLWFLFSYNNKVYINFCCIWEIPSRFDQAVTLTILQIFLKMSLVAMIEIVVEWGYRFFSIYTVNSLIKNKFKTHFIMSRSLFWVAESKKIKMRETFFSFFFQNFLHNFFSRFFHFLYNYIASLFLINWWKKNI